MTKVPKTAADCPVTLANGSTPRGEQPNVLYHGENDLWTVLWPKGIVTPAADQIASDGSIQLKWPWWRGPDASGVLHVEGRRLDADAPPLQAEVNPAYGDTTGFQPTGLIFPTEGCWEIRATAGHSSILVVQRVTKPTTGSFPPSQT